MSDNTKIIQIKRNETLLSSITFLLLEDMDNLRERMVKDLRSIGINGKIFEAPDVKTALTICSKEKIEFVISDWNLPDGTGHDFLKKIRSVERYKKTPFVMCTTNSEINFFLEAIASGANDYIVKPWEVDELKKKVFLTWETYMSKNKV